MISVLIPTRKRTKYLRDTLDNLFSLANDHNDVEIDLAVDIDDDETLEFKYSNFKINKVIFNDRQPGVIGYFNGLKDFKGDVAWIYSDENVCKTKGWDEKIRYLLADIPSKVWMARTQNWFDDGTYSFKVGTTEPFSFFPIVTRKLVDILGWIYLPELSFWGGDIVLDNILCKTNCLYDINIGVETKHEHSPDKMVKYINDLTRMVSSGKAKQDGGFVYINNDEEVNRIKQYEEELK